jgi:uncharacterized membrane protein YraQ (UPF0718 family)
MIIFEFLNDLFLKMTWLQSLVDYILISIFQLNEQTLLFKSLSFFVYDVIKIFILLSILIFLATYIQSYFSPKKSKAMLEKIGGIPANILGALLGTLTPFCSCSSIPIFIGFSKAGLPLGVTFSFLISSPLVDLASVILLASIFNWRIALTYVVVGLLIAVIGGTIISKLKMEKYIESFVLAKPTTTLDSITLEQPPLSKKERAKYSYLQVIETIKKVYLYVFIGVGIGAIIHGYIPESIILAILGSENIFSVPLATLVGIPMYADIFGALPIAEALVLKGVGIGTVLSFMMAVTALSLPSIIMLKKVIKTPLLLTFIGIVTIGIIIFGYFFNGFAYLFI